MAVVIIIGIMSLGGVAAFRGFRQKTSVRTAARDVTNIMRLARRKAIIEREDYLALYDLKNEKVWVQSYSAYSSYGTSPDLADFGTVQTLPKTAVIVRVKSNVADGRTGTGDPISTTDDYEDSGKDIGYHKFTPKSTAPLGTVFLKDDSLENFYKVTVINTTARARIYSAW